MLRYSQAIGGRRPFGKLTQNAGTVITRLIEPMNPNLFTMLDFLQVTVGATAHTLTIMRPLSRRLNGSNIPCSCYLTAAAAASQAVININQDPGVYTAYNFNGSNAPRTANNAIAGSDYVAFQYPDGTWGVDTVSSVSTLAVTLSNNLATGGLAAGAPVWFFGVTTNVNPYDAEAHPAFTLGASTTYNFGSEGSPFMASFNRGEPLLIYINNATNASTIERGAAIYALSATPFTYG